jgi:murein DD-endopeptidase MepM/ murein hydrolase activator NlpD
MSAHDGLLGYVRAMGSAPVGAAALALACQLGALPFADLARAQGVTGGTPGPALLDAAREQALSGGTQAPAEPLAGGSEYGVHAHPLTGANKPSHPSHPSTRRPSSHSRRPTRKPRPAPAHAKAPSTPTSPAPAPSSTPIAGVPTPQQTASGAVFPVAGPHSYGDAANRFGAAREGHIHQGQDVLAAEGTAIVAPLAGTITTTGYQAGGAGYYAVEHATDGFDLMFAHCEAGSLAVAEGQALSAGQSLCRVGMTGDATGPHLHFEMWVGGWQAPAGRPIDPLPYLEAWEGAGAGG